MSEIASCILVLKSQSLNVTFIVDTRVEISFGQKSKHVKIELHINFMLAFFLGQSDILSNDTVIFFNIQKR